MPYCFLYYGKFNKKSNSINVVLAQEQDHEIVPLSLLYRCKNAAVDLESATNDESILSSVR